MSIIILDTGCIDLLLCREGGKYTSFQKKVKRHELKGRTIGTTIINYAERQSGLKKWENQIHFPEKEIEKEKNKAEEQRQYKLAKIRQINDFFRIIDDNDSLFGITKNTAIIYANLFFEIKENFLSNVSKKERKSMHNDIWIASICLEHKAKLYTSNKKDFEKIKNIEPNLDVEYVEK
jgi:predicted nucleic acid-binding protein